MLILDSIPANDPFRLLSIIFLRLFIKRLNIYEGIDGDKFMCPFDQ